MSQNLSVVAQSHPRKPQANPAPARSLHPLANQLAMQNAASHGVQLRRVRSQASSGFVFEVYYHGQLIISEKAWVSLDACHLALMPMADAAGFKLLLVQSPAREGGRGQISVYRVNGHSVLHYPLQHQCKQLRLDQQGMSVFFENGDAIRLRCKA